MYAYPITFFNMEDVSSVRHHLHTVYKRLYINFIKQLFINSYRMFGSNEFI